MRYVIAHNNNTVHFSELDENQEFSTAMPLEEFTDRTEWENRLKELGVEDIPEPSKKPKVWDNRQKNEIKKLENALKEENKRLKAENKELRDRIADATDFEDLKGKLKQIKDSETTPEKWSDKSRYLKGQYVEHKGLNYRVLEDHESDKDKEPYVTHEWYERI